LSLFKKKQGDNIATDNCFPEYHKCPVCGELVKTKPNVIENYKEKYLDGQRKIPFDVLIGCYHLCENCGYVYISTDYNQIKTVYDSIKNIVFSDKYQSTRNDSAISMSLKKLMLLEEISHENTIYACEINQLWLDYYLKQNDEEKVQEYLLKRIEEIPRGLVFAKDLLPNQAPFDNKTRIQISSNAVLIDLYRRSGQVDKAKELINYAFEHYNFSQNHDTKKYYEYQLKLVEDHDKRHI
jgi:hypothetical protein